MLFKKYPHTYFLIWFLNVLWNTKQVCDPYYTNKKETTGTQRLIAKPNRTQIFCGILVPRPGIEPRPRQWKHQVLTTGQPGNSWTQIFFFKVIFFKLIYLFLAALGLRCCTWAFSSCGARASHCSGFSCYRARALGTWASVVVAHRLSSCGSWALERRLSSCGAWA